MGFSGQASRRSSRKSKVEAEGVDATSTRKGKSHKVLLAILPSTKRQPKAEAKGCSIHRRHDRARVTSLEKGMERGDAREEWW